MTYFAIVASYQVHEWYGDDDFVNGRYKAKGGCETICSPIMNLEQVMLLSADEKQAMVDAARPKSDDWFQYSRESWELVTLDQELIESIRAFIATEDTQDLGYVRYCFGGSEFEFDWACREDNTLLDSFMDDCYSNKYDKALILRTEAA